LQGYVKYLEEHLLTFSSYTFRKDTMDAQKIKSLYQESFSAEPIFVRLDAIADRIADIYETDHDTDVPDTTRDEIKRDLYKMAGTQNVLELYGEFIASLKTKYPVLEHDSISENLMYEDVFPVLLLKFMLFGRQKSRFDRIKHVIVDEMQDYSMIQYELLHFLFHCKMTILGDIHQTVDKGGETFLEQAEELFGQKITVIKMLKSYRSTYEICEFCKKLCHLADTESFERHGKPPVLEECADYGDMVARIQSRMDGVNLSEITNLAVICKTAAAAEKLYGALDEKHRECCYLLGEEDAEFHEGILISSAYLVKGLEFDAVIVPEVTEEEYCSQRDRQILYIAATRALHELDVLYFGRKSPFLEDV
ncbi:MAG: ATP-binding domain-containing protein, partial [Lachnospiraceae bacterium]|nr:ATP-binding domain-containing protein [Lachnospiraceae bacterium]